MHGDSTAFAGTARGIALLHDPLLNKGTAFTREERDALGLQGLLPAAVSSQEAQVDRLLERLRCLPDPLSRHEMLATVRDRNEALYFRAVIDHPDELFPIVYTPTVGAACQQYGRLLESPRGLFVDRTHRGRMREVLDRWPARDVAIIVVTDGGRILGLGDLGANGMGIPIGKLVLYTACAGVAPERCLPVMLDTGTDNAALLADPTYVGTRARRLARAEYDAMIAEFVDAANAAYPGVLIQFEDFANRDAFPLLDRYRDRICAFNDDIQGTGAVTLAGILSALRITGGSLTDQRILCLGAGGAATGLARLLVAAMTEEGLTEDAARQRLWMFDTGGLVVAERRDLAGHKRPFAHEHPPVDRFADAVAALKPTAIIGASTAAGAFDEEVLGTMARQNANPIVFALSNPTSKSECTAEQAYAATGGRALYASGSPFPPCQLDGGRHVPRQCNNSYVFPGIGLGAVASRTRRITDAMFLAAARTLAGAVGPDDLAQGSLFPALARIREVSLKIAVAVATIAHGTGLATREAPPDLEGTLCSQMYDGRYSRYR